MKNADLHIFKSPEDLADKFADLVMSWFKNQSGNTFHLAISGGRTPDLLFSVLAEKYLASELWQKVHFWWVDERMVPPNHPESNFGVAQKLLFSKISIPEENIHRIKGENDPGTEVLSYSRQIQEHLPYQENWPVFDLILLGMGDDGHTASIFPDQMELMHSDSICALATQPQSGQKRLTLTGNVINQASQIAFQVTGLGKANRISEIFNQTKEAENLPASHISAKSGRLNWYLDEAAACKIS